MIPMTLTKTIQKTSSKLIEKPFNIFTGFGYTPPSGRGFGFPLLPPVLFSPPKGGKLYTKKGKQRRKYNPSVLGMFLNKSIIKAPTGLLTGIEIRPMIGKTKKTKHRRKR
jgi:hypothetical protein